MTLIARHWIIHQGLDTSVSCSNVWTSRSLEASVSCFGFYKTTLFLLCAVPHNTIRMIRVLLNTEHRHAFSHHRYTKCMVQ